MVNVVAKFNDIDTPKIWAYIYNDSDELVDPDAVVLYLYDPDGTLTIDGESMNSSVTGTYYYQYHKGASEDPMASGQWRGIVKVTDGTGDEAVISSASFGFRVK